MSEEKIQEIAKSKIREYEKISDEAYIESMKQKYVKITEDRARPGEVKTKKAWVVRFIDNKRYNGAWLEIVLDDDGKVLRVDKSR